jgi:hypothetical protein
MFFSRTSCLHIFAKILVWYVLECFFVFQCLLNVFTLLCLVITYTLL